MKEIATIEITTNTEIIRGGKVIKETSSREYELNIGELRRSSLEDYMNYYRYKETSAAELFEQMFNVGEGYIQKSGEEKGKYKANPLLYYKNQENKKGNYRILFEDTYKETIKEGQEADFCITNGITYFGRKNTMEHASKMFAMIFDIDGITEKGLNTFFHQCEIDYNPLPNYIALSGHGIHLYYLFEEPIPLYPNIKIQLKELKYALTKRLWNVYITELEIQKQGIYQGFRIVGGKTKLDNIRVKLYKVNPKKWNIESLNRYVPEESQVDTTALFRESKKTIEEAKQEWPDWYQRIVLNKEPKGSWTCKEDLYKWFIKKIIGESSVGHRYFAIMCLSVYAIKCNIPFERLEKDAYMLREMMDITEENPFTEADIKSALEAYDYKFKNFSIDTIEQLTAIRIEKNRRNGRKQETHLILARAQKEALKKIGEMKKEGRPKGTTKAFIVQEWRKNNPEGKKIDCERETKLSRHTVLKHWDT